ncbi:MAG: hypothetical protein ABSC94_02910 [Polyangiaceae bacterium]
MVKHGSPPASDAEEWESASVPSAVEEDSGSVATASHEALFEVVEATWCDACGAKLDDDDSGAPYEVRGRGAYMWTRGDDVRFDEAPLCAPCASAIGMTALARWEIEEEEG